MSRRLAAYALCLESGRVLLARHRSGNWTLPGGGVEAGEDPFDAVTRELAEETGLVGAVERLLGVDSRLIPSAERTDPSKGDHQNIGVFYEVRVSGGQLRPEANGDTTASVWVLLSEVGGLRRSSLVDVGLALVRHRPATGHVPPVPIDGRLLHH
ncbi:MULTISPECIES: NUDIX hydrolase [Streptomyces]|uniref:NUDIX domain-containing protein n=1 Tax=Streptomyces koyangensis TaxID=188770 RepID=A0A385DJL9_9ACTN|nr:MULTISPECIES: NUDIX domain-containing protein [Streptomyces]AXQ58635.1 NUDIX domain-containing protein [Streptomyces koyangensis]PKR45856.1 NUDIX hydrolase [Streptomyces sp. EAG2]WTD01169.1 NUDIX domain-containing protein [Streptomyces albidoflavus]